MNKLKKLKIFTDGGSRGNPGPAGIGVWVETDKDAVFKQSLYIGRATNNEAEYRAFLASLNWLEQYLLTNKVSGVEWFLDSKLVVEQINQNWKIKEERLRKIARQCWQKLAGLNVDYKIKHVLREKNKQADLLVNQAIDAHFIKPIKEL
jgi:ribonuclease HI